jgi:hypothetical protein
LGPVAVNLWKPIPIGDAAMANPAEAPGKPGASGRKSTVRDMKV